ncbi:hypothetical protein AGLY_014720, partial [Aphis glycines]
MNMYFVLQINYTIKNKRLRHTFSTRANIFFDPLLLVSSNRRNWCSVNPSTSLAHSTIAIATDRRTFSTTPKCPQNPICMHANSLRTFSWRLDWPKRVSDCSSTCPNHLWKQNYMDLRKERNSLRPSLPFAEITTGTGKRAVLVSRERFRDERALTTTYGNRRNDRKIVFRADDGDGGDDDDDRRISASPAREHMVVEKYNSTTAVKGWLLLAKQLMCFVGVRVDKPGAATP